MSVLNKRIAAIGAGTLIGAFGAHQLFSNEKSLRFTPALRATPSGNGSSGNGSGKALIAAGAGVNTAVLSSKKEQDYQKIYNGIALKLRDEDEYDEYIGFGPGLVRLAWHLSGTYAQAGHEGCPFQSGGSYGGTIRLSKEALDPANNGLQNSRKFLEEFKEDWISYGDLYTLGGVVAVQEMGGPKVGWRQGRVDKGEEFASTSRLPDASRDASYVRNLFGRMGFNDQEVVSLLGAHSLGSCHVLAPIMPGETESSGPGSGYTGRWTASANYLTTEFYRLLLEDEWHLKKWDGPEQYENKDGLMMLPTDYSLIEDPKYKEWVVKYSKDQDLFFKHFAKDFQKLLELGIEFPKESKTYYFKTLDDQEL